MPSGSTRSPRHNSGGGCGNVYSRAASTGGSSQASSPGGNKAARRASSSISQSDPMDRPQHHHHDSPSPRQFVAGLWDSFRPRSKSETTNSRRCKPPPLLFVDTRLANRRSLDQQDHQDDAASAFVHLPSSGGLFPAGGGGWWSVGNHNSGGGVVENVYAEFARIHRCYDLIPISGKLLALDTQLTVLEAYSALVANGARSGSLWDSSGGGGGGGFVGLLTTTDLVRALRTHCPPMSIDQLQRTKIASLPDLLTSPVITIDPNMSLLDTVRLLDQQDHELVDGAPVVDPATGNILYILTHKRILRFLRIYMTDLPRPAFLSRPPLELGVGSWQRIDQEEPATTTTSAALLVRCSRTDSLEKVIGTLTDRCPLGTVPITDHDQRVIGSVSAKDVVQYLLLAGGQQPASF